MRDTAKQLIRFLLTKKYQLSLAVLIPIFLGLFAFGPMSIAIETIEKLRPDLRAAGAVSPEAADETLGMLRVVLWVSVIAAVGSGLVLSYSILSPLKRFMQTAGAGLGSRQRAEPLDDLDILGRDFSVMLSSLGRYVSILQGMSGGVAVFDQAGRLTALNPSAEALLGRRSEELLGRDASDICRSIVRSPDMERVLRDGLRNRRAYISEEVRIGALGGKETIVGMTTSLLQDAGGTPSGIVVNFMDLTGVQRMHEELQQKLRTAGLGRLAAGVAHEVRNPLAAIKGMAQLIQEGLPDDDPRKQYGRVIAQETDRLNNVVEDLLRLVQGPAARTPCDLNSLLLQARDLALPGLCGKQVAFIDERGTIPEFRGERERMVQAFLNIFLNALEAVPDGGKVRYRTGFDPGQGALSIEIANTGEPIPPDVRERMFEPFFTTKERGSGLGLSITHQIITSHGGTIAAQEADQETVMRITLPAE